MNKKGIVMELKKDKAGILTSSGEFVYIKLSSNPTTLGQCIEGSLIENNNKSIIKRLSLLVASLLLIFLGSGVFIYNKPVSAVTISINPAVKLEVNRWNRIISIDFINEDGKKILSNLNLKNLDIEKALNIIVEEAKKENFINEDYIENSKVISIETEGNIKNFNIDTLKDTLDKNGLKYMIKNGKEIQTNVEDNKSTESKEQPNSQINSKDKPENLSDPNKNSSKEDNENHKENIDKSTNSGNKPNENTRGNDKTNENINNKPSENMKKNNNQDTPSKSENKGNSTEETKEDNKHNNGNSRNSNNNISGNSNGSNKEKKKP